MLLIDNNLYDKIRKSEKGVEISYFLDQLKKEGLISRNGSKLLLAPTTVIEALGIKFNKAKYYAELPQNNDVELEHFTPEAFKHFKGYVEKQDLEQIALSQQSYTKPIAKVLEDALLKQINRPFFKDELALTLTFDSLFNQKYSKEQFDAVIYKYAVPFLFFKQFEYFRNVSQLRIATKILNRPTNPMHEAKNNDFSKAVKLKSGQDYVDCDLIHRVAIGSYNNSRYHTIVAATLDDANVVRDRIAIYKRYLNLLLSSFIEDQHKILCANVAQMWSPGIVVVCDSNLKVTSKIIVKDV